MTKLMQEEGLWFSDENESLVEVVSEPWDHCHHCNDFVVLVVRPSLSTRNACYRGVTSLSWLTPLTELASLFIEEVYHDR